MTASTAPRTGRRPGRRIGALFGLALMGMPSFAAAQDDLDPPPDRIGPIERDADGNIVRRDGDDRPPAGATGRLRRDADGNIVEIGPAVAPPPGARANGGQAGVEAAFTRLTRLNRSSHDAAVQAQQVELRRIMREEQLAKRRGAKVNERGLTAREQAIVDQLSARDREVRAHEMRHYQTGAPYSKAPEYWTVVGPDRRSYAIAGITPLDLSIAGHDQMSAIRKLETLKRAALAPSRPSDYDRQIADEIERLIAKLRQM